MKIVTLMENTTCREDLTCEHGLSLYIETGDQKILFDAGQSGAFADNAEKLSIDLAQVDFAVLSHGHYDHGGGLGCFLEINQTAPIYLSRYAFEAHHNATGKYIGLDPALMDSGRLIFVDDKMELGEGITICACRECACTQPIDSAGLTVLENGMLNSEDFRHEQYLLLEENGRQICISGCSHRGILNITDWFRPDVLVGGFHFMKVEDLEILNHAAEALLTYPTTYYTGHCTGEAQFAYMKTIMEEKLHSLSTGKAFVI